MVLFAIFAYINGSPLPEAKADPQVLLTTQTINGVPTAVRYINPGLIPTYYTAPLAPLVTYTQPLTIVQTPNEVVQANL